MDLGWLVNHSNPNLQQDDGGGVWKGQESQQSESAHWTRILWGWEDYVMRKESLKKWYHYLNIGNWIHSRNEWCWLSEAADNTNSLKPVNRDRSLTYIASSRFISCKVASCRLVIDVIGSNTQIYFVRGSHNMTWLQFRMFCFCESSSFLSE